MNTNKRIIQVVAYDPKWPELFQIESKALAVVFGDEIMRVHHIGSTAVPGLAAKPIIDILLEVKDVNALDEYNPEMERLGYTPKGEYGIPGRRFFLKDLQNRTHHVHAFNAGSPDVIDYIAFRDYLIAHPQVAKEYGDLKQRCARDCDNDVVKYMNMKQEFVKEHIEKAIQWMRGQ